MRKNTCLKPTLLAIMVAATITLSSFVSAAVYTYKQTNGDVLTIDTLQKTGSLVGPNRNVTFYGPDLGSFTGGDTPTGNFDISIDSTSTMTAGWQYNVGNYIDPNGTTYSPYFDGHHQMLNFNTPKPNTYILWAIWKDPNNTKSIILGDVYGKFDESVPPAALPEANILALLSLGLVGLLFIRHRKPITINSD